MKAAQAQLDPARLAEALRPVKLHYYPELRSTNDTAAELRRAGSLFAPAIVLTPRQTAGRGRGANRWFSSEDCLTITYALPVEEPLAPHQLPLVAGLAVRHAAAELTGNADICLKWPNDVLHANRKLAGLLCERLSGVDLIGIGMNVNDAPRPDNQRYASTSLTAIAGRRLDLHDVIVTLTRHLTRLLMARHSHPFAAFVDEYRQHDGLLGCDVSVSTSAGAQPIRGTCEGIDQDGRLLVREGARVHRVLAGSVTITSERGRD